MLTDSEKSVGHFLAKHIWIPVVGAIVLAAIVGLLVYCLYRYRRRKRYRYSELYDHSAHLNTTELERSYNKEDKRDLALLNCSLYMRSNGKYSLVDHLPEIGSRLNKQWFQVENSEGRCVLLTMMKKDPKMSVIFNRINRDAMASLFEHLTHPYLLPIYKVDFVISQELLVTIQPFSRSGSLKDVIYGSHCLDSWQAKYCFKSKGLSTPQIQTFGSQILEVLLHLESLNLPPFNQLHSGNVIVQDNVCRLTGYENTLLGFSSKLDSLLRKKLQASPYAMETLSFGHLIFEMAAGFELDSPEPEDRHIHVIRQDAVREVVQFIFGHKSGQLPTIAEIAAHDFFSVTLLAKISQTQSQQSSFPDNVQTFLKQLPRKNQRHHRPKIKSPEDNAGSSCSLKPSRRAPKNYGSNDPVTVQIDPLAAGALRESNQSQPGNIAMPPPSSWTSKPQNSSRVSPSTTGPPRVMAPPIEGSSATSAKPKISRKPSVKEKSTGSKNKTMAGNPGGKSDVKPSVEDKSSVVPAHGETTERSQLLADIRRGVSLKKGKKSQRDNPRV